MRVSIWASSIKGYRVRIRVGVGAGIRDGVGDVGLRVRDKYNGRKYNGVRDKYNGSKYNGESMTFFEVTL